MEPFNSRRAATRARHGMVASSQPLAAQVGLQVLKDGGNAVDAAIAVAAMVNVTEPMMNGLGGDSFILVHWQGKLHGLNAGAAILKVRNFWDSRISKSLIQGWDAALALPR
jgi:gamma-glutamyltranspeptidase/glutathione hydrolase